MKKVQATYRGGEVITAFQFDGTKNSANAIVDSIYFNGSISYEGGNVREFSFFDIFSKKYNPIHEGDWFVLRNAESPGESTVYVHMKPTVFHTFFSEIPAQSHPDYSK